MSSDYAFIAYLAEIQRNFYRIGGPISMVLGTVSCILNLMVFTRKNLRKNSCAIYLVAYNICNLLLIFAALLFFTLTNGYNIDLGLNNLGFCRFRVYTAFVLQALGPSYLILASIDRVLLTSRNALTRQRSTPRLAYISIILMTIFWASLHIHALILTNFVQIGPGSVSCSFQIGMHRIIMSYYSLVVKNILIPLLMLGFGLWAVKNVRTVAHVTPVSVSSMTTTAITRNMRTDRSRDRQMLLILLVDIAVHVAFNLMTAVAVIYSQINQSRVINAVEIQIQSLLANVGIICAYIPFCVGCYANLIASKTFRQEMKNIILCK